MLAVYHKEQNKLIPFFKAAQRGDYIRLFVRFQVVVKGKRSSRSARSSVTGQSPTLPP